MFIVIIGPAASGKTSLALKLSEHGILINLDPATDIEANVNIRKWIKVEDIQKKYNLGINGALLKSMELISKNDEWINKDKNEFKVIDTPGQLEIFLYHDYGKRIIKKLSSYDDVVITFVVDATEILSVENYLAILAQNAMINLKLIMPSITVINKIDLVEKEDLMKYIDRINLEKILKEGDALYSLATGLIDYIEYTSIYQRPLLISAKTGEGIDNLYSAIHEIHCACGDLS